MDTIKCRREVFELRDGDTVMDNGACRQLITREVGGWLSKHSPRVSNAEFARFKELSAVSRKVEVRGGIRVALWVYSSPK